MPGSKYFAGPGPVSMAAILGLCLSDEEVMVGVGLARTIPYAGLAFWLERLLSCQSSGVNVCIVSGWEVYDIVE